MFDTKKQEVAEAKRLSNFCLPICSSRVPSNFKQPKRLGVTEIFHMAIDTNSKAGRKEEVVYLWEYVHLRNFTVYRLRIPQLHSFLLLYFYLYVFLLLISCISLYLAPYFLFPFFFLINLKNICSSTSLSTLF